MNEKLLFKDYLDCIFTSQQQKILAYCVKNNINVCLYGTGLGKSLTAGIFRMLVITMYLHLKIVLI